MPENTKEPKSSAANWFLKNLHFYYNYYIMFVSLCQEKNDCEVYKFFSLCKCAFLFALSNYQKRKEA